MKSRRNGDIAQNKFEDENDDRNEKKNDDNLVLVVVLEKQKPIIPATIYGGEERGQMIIEKVGEQGQQYSREHRCVFHEKIVTLIGGL